VNPPEVQNPINPNRLPENQERNIPITKVGGNSRHGAGTIVAGAPQSETEDVAEGVEVEVARDGAMFAAARAAEADSSFIHTRKDKAHSMCMGRSNHNVMGMTRVAKVEVEKVGRVKIASMATVSTGSMRHVSTEKARGIQMRDDMSRRARAGL